MVLLRIAAILNLFNMAATVRALGSATAKNQKVLILPIWGPNLGIVKKNE